MAGMDQSMNRPMMKTINPINPSMTAKTAAPAKNVVIATRIRMNPIASHLKPALSTRTEWVTACGDGAVVAAPLLNGAPQPGHAPARSEISFPHSLHLISAIQAPYAFQQYIDLCNFRFLPVPLMSNFNSIVKKNPCHSAFGRYSDFIQTSIIKEFSHRRAFFQAVLYLVVGIINLKFHTTRYSLPDKIITYLLW